MKKEEILIVVPARYEASRFPGKLMQEIGGFTIVQHVCQRLSTLSHRATIIVATDSTIIYNHVQELGYQAMMTSKVHTCGTERCAEVALVHPKARIVINVQGDEPFIDAAAVGDVIDLLANDESVELCSLYGALDCSASAIESIVKVEIDGDDYAVNFCRIVNATQVYYQHIGLYGFSREVLLDVVNLPPSQREIENRLEQLRWMDNGYRIKMLATDYQSISIDTPEDLSKAIEMHNKKNDDQC